MPRKRSTKGGNQTQVQWKQTRSQWNGRKYRVTLFPYFADREMPSENQAGAGNTIPRDTYMANATMVCRIAPDANRRTNSDSLHGGSSHITSRRATSTITSKQNESSSLEGVRVSANASQISEQARDLLNKNIRDGTKSTYKTPWIKWVRWCSGKQINLVQAPVEHIVNFLIEKFHEPLQFSTLNVYRSALSAHHPEIDGFKVGQHPLVTKLMNTRPPRPR